MPNTQRNIHAGPDLRQRLEAACDDLVYVSETDSPVLPVFEPWKAGESLWQFVSRNVETSRGDTEERPASTFFNRLTCDRDWHTPEDAKTVSRFRQLRDLLFNHLSGVKVFRTGRIRVEIFVLGRDSDGNILGIRTAAVET